MEYAGSGITGPYPYTFQIFVAGHLVVTVIDPDGTEHILNSATDYTATGIGSIDGGTVTLTAAIAETYTLVLERSVPFVQEATNFLNQGPFFPDALEKAFDYGVMIDQQLTSSITRLKDDLEERIALIEEDLNSIHLELGGISAALATINDRLLGIEEDLAEIRGDIIYINSQLMDMGVSLDALDIRLFNVESDITNLQAAIVALNPMTHAGDMIIGGTDGVSTRLAYQPQSEGTKFLITRYETPEWTQFVIGDYLPSPPFGTAGDMLYIDAQGEWATLGIGNESDVLTIVSGLPAWVPNV
jgi:archaellum component FlaC